MSRLSELIAELCPDGVEYKTLGEVIVLCFGERITKSKSIGTAYPVYGGGGESFRTDNWNREDKCVVSRFAMSEQCVRHVNGKFWLMDSGLTFEAIDSRLERYIEKWLSANQLKIYACSTKSAQRNLKTDLFLRLRIPVPPLEVQREIVRILDSFQELDDALTAEIEAREKQFEKYRDELLEERLQKMCPDGVEYKKLVAVADVLYGAAFRSALFNTDGDGLPVIRIRDVLRGYSETFYSGEYEQKYVIGDGDMLLGMDGNFNLRLWSGGKALLNQRVCRISSKDDAVVLNGFLRYWLQPVFKSYEGDISRTTVAHMSARVINGIRIPVPPIEVQREIVRILDSFQDHIDTMRSEREARRKQFEYYRDRLLTFTEKAA